MPDWLDDILRFAAWMLALTAIFALLESWRPAAPTPWRERARNLAYLLLALPLIVALQRVGAPLHQSAIAWSHGGLIEPWLPADRWPFVDIVLSLAFVFVWDLWQYGVHRWQHASPLLWRTHRFHHSDPCMNATTQGRHHLASHALNFVCYTPVLLVIGALHPPALLGILCFRIWGFVNHTSLRLPFGVFTGVIAGPQWHRIHHSRLAAHRDRNFATFFPVIDRLFGTYHAPARDEWPPTGLDEAPPFLTDATLGPLLPDAPATRPASVVAASATTAQ